MKRQDCRRKLFRRNRWEGEGNVVCGLHGSEQVVGDSRVSMLG